jgi:6-phospho-3-hexuloisomerase
MVERAVGLGAFVVTVTAAPHALLAGMADLVIEVPAPRAVGTSGDLQSIQPLGSLFDQWALLLFDSVVLDLMRRTDKSAEVVRQRQANLG